MHVQTGVGSLPTPEKVHCQDCLVLVASVEEEVTLRRITCKGLWA